MRLLPAWADGAESRTSTGTGRVVRRTSDPEGGPVQYDGPGFYGPANWNRSAEFVYNHFHNAPGLLWLAEAVGVPRFALVKARDAVLEAESSAPARAAALRKVLPWPLVEALLKARE